MNFQLSSNIVALILLSIVFMGSCSPKSDPIPPPIELTRKYCNDPLAINYNDSFPGIPDNSRCLYPYDPFLGTWRVQDSIFKEDQTFLYSEEKDIQFEIVPNELKNKMKVYNWCNSGPIDLIAHKGSISTVINTLTYPDSAQIACGGDSVMGSFRLILLHPDSMSIEFTHRSNTGTVNIHKATAKKN